MKGLSLNCSCSEALFRERKATHTHQTQHEKQTQDTTAGPATRAHPGTCTDTARKCTETDFTQKLSHASSRDKPTDRHFIFRQPTLTRMQRCYTQTYTGIGTRAHGEVTIRLSFTSGRSFLCNVTSQKRLVWNRSTRSIQFCLFTGFVARGDCEGASNGLVRCSVFMYSVVEAWQ